MLDHSLADFRVALEALELSLAPAQFVAFCAVRRTGERLVRLGERSGRNL